MLNRLGLHSPSYLPGQDLHGIMGNVCMESKAWFTEAVTSWLSAGICRLPIRGPEVHDVDTYCLSA